MKKIVLIFIAMLLCMVASAQTLVFSKAKDGYTNIRSTNNTNGRIIGELRNGGGAAVYMHTSGSWYKVNYNGIVGYVHKSQVRLSEPARRESNPIRFVYSDAKDGYTNLRKGPGTNYEIIDEMRNGNQATYISTSGNWYKVKFYGTIGYVHKSQVKVK